MVWEENTFKDFLIWLQWQPEFFMEHKYLKEFEEDYLENIPVKFNKNPVNSFCQRRSFLKAKFTDAHTDEQTDGQTDRQMHNKHNTMTKACWPSASGAKEMVYNTHFPSLPFHNLTDLSKEALAKSRVSGENLTSFINCWCPVILVIGLLSLSGYHRNRVKSSEPETILSGPSPCHKKIDGN